MDPNKLERTNWLSCLASVTSDLIIFNRQSPQVILIPLPYRLSGMMSNPITNWLVLLFFFKESSFTFISFSCRWMDFALGRHRWIKYAGRLKVSTWTDTLGVYTDTRDKQTNISGGLARHASLTETKALVVVVVVITWMRIWFIQYLWTDMCVVCVTSSCCLLGRSAYCTDFTDEKKAKILFNGAFINLWKNNTHTYTEEKELKSPAMRCASHPICHAL